MPEDTRDQQQDIRISSLENSVGRLEERFDNLELQNRATADDIIHKFDEVAKALHVRISDSKEESKKEISALSDKLEATKDKYSDNRAMSSTTIIGLCSFVWIVIIAAGGLIMNFSNNAAVTETALTKEIERVDERHGILVDDFEKQTLFEEEKGNAEVVRIWDEIDEIEDVLNEKLALEIQRAAAADAGMQKELEYLKKSHDEDANEKDRSISADSSQDARIDNLENIINKRLLNNNKDNTQ